MAYERSVENLRQITTLCSPFWHCMMSPEAPLTALVAPNSLVEVSDENQLITCDLCGKTSMVTDGLSCTGDAPSREGSCLDT